MTDAIWISIGLCLGASVLLVAAEVARPPAWRAVLKLTASTAFIAVAWQAGALQSRYGIWIACALVLSWVGDALLLSDRMPLFLSGIGAFLLAHVAYAIGFASTPVSMPWLLAGIALMAMVGGVTLKWLWPHLDRFFRAAVGLYVLALAAMCALALSSAAAVGLPSIAVGALAFAASDISVARDRFVAPGVLNRVWGLPLYYLAQVLLALSVARVG